LSDTWQDMEPLRQTTEQSLTELAHKTAGVIVYDHV
jgi:hypothetical protein